MIEGELWNRFRDRFLATARQRISVARGLFDKGAVVNAPLIVSELHALAGEASVIGVEEVARLARLGETAWKGEDAERVCKSALDDLDAEIARLAAN